MRWMRSWKLAVSVLLLAAQTSAANVEPLRFTSDVTPREFAATIGGDLTFPAGPGPFPVVVFMHACGGLDRFARSSFAAHARYLSSAGFGAYILDSFTVRNLAGGKLCDRTALSGDAIWFRLDDAFNAIDALRKHAKVSKENVFLVGQSHGANVGLRAALGVPNRYEFRAIAAFYPSCYPLHNALRLKTPLIVFAGGKDDWTPAHTCTRAKKIDRSPSAEFELVVYPDAYHSFDQARPTIKYKGHALVYDRHATADSQKKMREFFVKHLTDEVKGASPYLKRAPNR